MRQKLEIVENNVGPDGTPMGGRVQATGLSINWQHGALGQGADRQDPNGAFVEGVLEAAKQRLEHYQETKFKCAENADAIEHIELALASLDARTQRRTDAGTEGTHKADEQKSGDGGKANKKGK